MISYRSLACGLACIVLAGCAHTQQAEDDVAVLDGRASAISDALSVRIGGMAKRLKVAVMPFSDRTGRSYDLGPYLSEKIVTRLGGTGHLELIERTRMDEVVKAIGIESSVLVSDETAKTVGEMAGADAIIIGTLTDLGTVVDLNARVVETESGNILGTASESVDKSPLVKWLLGQGPQPEPARSNALAWTSTGVAVVGAGAGTALAISTLSLSDVSRSNPEFSGSVDGTKDRALAANVSFAVGGVAALVAGVLFYLSMDDVKSGSVRINTSTASSVIGSEEI